MSVFHTTSYKVYNSKVEKDIKFCIESDLHFSSEVSNRKLSNISLKISNDNPNYILMPGDIVDSISDVRSKFELDRLLSWLKEVGSIAPTLISLGNHDCYAKTDNGWSYELDKDFFERINSINNINILNNESYNDSNIFVTGVTQNLDVYHISDDSKSLLLSDLDNKLPLDIPNDKVNILLIHSPSHINDLDVLKRLDNYDFIICGHMHNGCVLPIMYELWNSDRGLISPEKSLFPKNVRNTLVNREDKVIVNGPPTMFAKCTNNFQKFNFIYPIYDSTLELSNNKKYDKEKVLVKRKYKRLGE